jgi:hypothetical protein
MGRAGPVVRFFFFLFYGHLAKLVKQSSIRHPK